MADSAATSSFEELSFSIDSISSESKSKIKPRKTTRSCPKPSAIIRDSLGETLFKLNKLVSTRQKPTASIHDLATEIVELVFQHLDLEDDLQALKNLPNLEALKIDHLKIYWYKCFLTWPLYVPVATKFLKKLHIDTRHEILDRKSHLTNYRFESPYLDGHYGFANLQSLIITQNPVFESSKDEYIDILRPWSRSCFPRLQSLELHFLSTSPDRLVDLLEACNHESLCRVRIYRPIWEPEELRHPRMQEYISTLKKDDKVIVEDSEPWNQFGQYSEEEFSFMIESDMFPLEWNMIVPEEGWASDVLNRYVEYRRVALKEEVLVFPGFRPKRDERRMATPTWIPRKGLDYTFIEDL
ncbi:MAG: hypothetical protein LQ350_007432 [Teloschistes chrysophthalmus]|nr:MAG: hypothetical protein LQ350_007432 [Niorma chrysophthalma]